MELGSTTLYHSGSPMYVLCSYQDPEPMSNISTELQTSCSINVNPPAKTTTSFADSVALSHDNLYLGLLMSPMSVQVDVAKSYIIVDVSVMWPVV